MGTELNNRCQFSGRWYYLHREAKSREEVRDDEQGEGWDRSLYDPRNQLGDMP